MDIQAEKLKLIDRILHTDNLSTLEKIKSIFQTDPEQDIWEELSEQQKSLIQSAFKEIEEGKTVSWDTFLKQNK